MKPSLFRNLWVAFALIFSLFFSAMASASYSFTPFTIGSSGTTILAYNDTTGLFGGGYVDTSTGVMKGFISQGTGHQDIAKTGAIVTAVTAIDDSGIAYGLYTLDGSGYVGFKFQNGSFTDILCPNSVNTFVRGVSGSGTVTGACASTLVRGTTPEQILPNLHRTYEGETGFTWTNGTFTAVNVGNYSTVEITGLDADGTLVGVRQNQTAAAEAFLVGSGDPVVIQKAANIHYTWASDILDGKVVGDYYDPTSRLTVAYVYDVASASFTDVVDPNLSTDTFAFGVASDGRVFGFRYANGLSEGFIATPQ
jgi:hypothetical protein